MQQFIVVVDPLHVSHDLNSKGQVLGIVVIPQVIIVGSSYIGRKASKYLGNRIVLWHIVVRELVVGIVGIGHLYIGKTLLELREIDADSPAVLALDNDGLG